MKNNLKHDSVLLALPPMITGMFNVTCNLQRCCVYFALDKAPPPAGEVSLGDPFRVMLADQTKGSVPTLERKSLCAAGVPIPFLIQPKLDGFRAVFHKNGDNLTFCHSRQNNPFKAPPGMCPRHAVVTHPTTHYLIASTRN